MLGKGEHQVDHPHQGGVDGAAEVAGGYPDQRARGEGDGDADDPDAQGNARSVEDAAEYVAPELVGAEGIRKRGRGEPLVEVLLERIAGSENRCEQGRNDQPGDDRSPADGQRMAAQRPLQRTAPHLHRRPGAGRDHDRSPGRICIMSGMSRSSSFPVGARPLWAQSRWHDNQYTGCRPGLVGAGPRVR